MTGRSFSNGIPVSFSLGLGVIALGVVLTIVYVAVTHREGAR
ncbi:MULTISPECIES: hypothetical protein [unclassified Variovorax]|nr:MULTISPECIES: hypothetical protein [unclassified Variovorax]MDM0088017.1 hypothetical protein [Variovorax sp. J22G40]MDM0146090.1 hypothetical protein [Variovorax sp. J2P1-31]